MSALSLKNTLRPLPALIMALSLSACTLGPDYQRPELQTPVEIGRAHV